MKIALITDPHLDFKKGDEKYFEYFMKFYSNIFFPTLKKENINTVVFLGDTFDHRKTLDIRSIENIKTRFFNFFLENNINLHMLVGNHDIYLRESNKINTPEIILSDFNNIKTYRSITDIEIGNLSICMCPWINKENKDEVIKHLQETESKVLFGHLELNGFELYKGFYMSGSDYNPDMFSSFDLVFSGHYHHRSTNGNIHYLGNPYQLVWSDCNDIRGFHIFDTETLELEFRSNNYTLFEKIYFNPITSDYSNFDYEFYRDKNIKIYSETDNTNLLNEFVEKLEKCNPFDIKIIENPDEKKVDFDVSTEDFLTQVYNHVIVTYEDLNPDKVKKTLVDLHSGIS